MKSEQDKTIQALEEGILNAVVASPMNGQRAAAVLVRCAVAVLVANGSTRALAVMAVKKCLIDAETYFAMEEKKL